MNKAKKTQLGRPSPMELPKFQEDPSEDPKASDLLKKVIPFKAWKSQRSPSAEDVDMYWRVVKGLKRSAKEARRRHGRP